MDNFNRFIEVVRKYAEAYDNFERMQKCPDFDFVPKIGDQKTGVIGEAFIFEYLRRQGHRDLEFGRTDQKGWDIKYPSRSAPNEIVFVQVKTVSAFAKYKRISPIHPITDYCEFYLVSLNENLIPDNIWKSKGYDEAKIKTRNGKKVVIGTRMPKDADDTASGFTGLENIFDDFKKTFSELY